MQRTQKNSKGSKVKGKFKKFSDRSSLRSRLDELDNLKMSKGSKGSITDANRSDFSDSQVGVESSLRETMDRKDKSLEQQQDDESVKALLTGFEDLTSNINAYFNTTNAMTNEYFDENKIEQLNDTNELRVGVDNQQDSVDIDSSVIKSWRDLINFDKISQTQKHDRLFRPNE